MSLYSFLEQAIFAILTFLLISTLARVAPQNVFGIFAACQGIAAISYFLAGSFLSYPLLFYKWTKGSEPPVARISYVTTVSLAFSIGTACFVFISTASSSVEIAASVAVWAFGWPPYDVLRRIGYIYNKYFLLIFAHVLTMLPPIAFAHWGTCASSHVIQICLPYSGLMMLCSFFMCFHYICGLRLSSAIRTTSITWHRTRWHLHIGKSLVAAKLLYMLPVTLAPLILLYFYGPSQSAAWQVLYTIATIPNALIFILGTHIVKMTAMRDGVQSIPGAHTRTARILIFAIFPLVAATPYLALLGCDDILRKIFGDHHFQSTDNSVAIALASGLAASLTHLHMCYFLGMRKPQMAIMHSITFFLFACVATLLLPEFFPDSRAHQIALYSWGIASICSLLISIFDIVRNWPMLKCRQQ